MAQYHIHHATGKDRFTETEVQPRSYAGIVEANNLDEAFAKSQNWDKPWNPVNPTRSTSVGDIIQGDEGFFMVKGMGFKQLED